MERRRKRRGKAVDVGRDDPVDDTGTQQEGTVINETLFLVADVEPLFRDKGLDVKVDGVHDQSVDRVEHVVFDVMLDVEVDVFWDHQALRDDHVRRETGDVLVCNDGQSLFLEAVHEVFDAFLEACGGRKSHDAQNLVEHRR